MEPTPAIRRADRECVAETRDPRSGIRPREYPLRRAARRSESNTYPSTRPARIPAAAGGRIYSPGNNNYRAPRDPEKHTAHAERPTVPRRFARAESTAGPLWGSRRSPEMAIAAPLRSPAPRCSGPSSAASRFHTQEWSCRLRVFRSVQVSIFSLSSAALLFLTQIRRAENGGKETLLARCASSIRNFSRIVFRLRAA